MFVQFPPTLRKVIYTTYSMELLNKPWSPPFDRGRGLVVLPCEVVNAVCGELAVEGGVGSVVVVVARVTGCRRHCAWSGWCRCGYGLMQRSGLESLDLSVGLGR